MNIEISYLLLFASIFIVAILTVTRKMSLGIGLVCIGLALLISWILAPYTAIVMSPVTMAIFYGGDWTLGAILGISHLISMILLVIVAVYNLMRSGGKIIWA